MYVPSKPFPYKELFVSNNGEIIERLKKSIFFNLGRDALLYGLIKMNIEKGQKILVPAYICYSFIEPLVHYGYEIIYLDVEKDLTFSLQAIRKKIDEVGTIRAAILVDYFGLGIDQSNLLEEFKSKNILTIGDYSHSLFSFLFVKRKSEPDIVILSARKTLPVPDGGILIINNEKFTINDSQNSAKHSSVYYFFIRILERVLLIFGLNIYSKTITSTKNRLRSIIRNTEKYSHRPKPVRPSKILKNYLTDLKKLRQISKISLGNFTKMSTGLQKEIFNQFSGNSYPQSLLIYDNSNEIINHLRSKSIGASKWPDYELPYEVVGNQKLYPNTMFYSSSLTHIPIHFSLSRRQLSYLKKALEN